MFYEVLQDKRDVTTWRVEAIDYENEGIGYVSLFVGPSAQERAYEYALWKNNATSLLQAA